MKKIYCLLIVQGLWLFLSLSHLQADDYSPYTNPDLANNNVSDTMEQTNSTSYSSNSAIRIATNLIERDFPPYSLTVKLDFDAGTYSEEYNNIHKGTTPLPTFKHERNGSLISPDINIRYFFKPVHQTLEYPQMFAPTIERASSLGLWYSVEPKKETTSTAYDLPTWVPYLWQSSTASLTSSYGADITFNLFKFLQIGGYGNIFQYTRTGSNKDEHDNTGIVNSKEQNKELGLDGGFHMGRQFLYAGASLFSGGDARNDYIDTSYSGVETTDQRNIKYEDNNFNMGLTGLIAVVNTNTPDKRFFINYNICYIDEREKGEINTVSSTIGNIYSSFNKVFVLDINLSPSTAWLLGMGFHYSMQVSKYEYVNYTIEDNNLGWGFTLRGGFMVSKSAQFSIYITPSFFNMNTSENYPTLSLVKEGSYRSLTGGMSLGFNF